MACDEGVQLPKYLEELLAELTGPFLRPREEVSTGHVREDAGGITETVKETVKCQELDANDRRGSLFEKFVAAGFAWSVRKKRRGAGGGGARSGGAVAASNGFEPQILWKNDVKGGRPVSKREEIRRKIATPEEAPSRNPRPRGSKAMGPRPSSRQTNTGRLESLLDMNMIKTATDPGSLEITGFDLLGIETTGDLTPTPHRHNTPTPVTPRSRSSRPSTPARETGSRTECPMLVRSLVPVSYSPTSDPERPEFFEFPEPQRQLTQESSMELPLELPLEDGFFRAVSCAKRGKQRALSSSFLRQISPMLRQISPDRRPVSESGSSRPLSEFRRARDVRDDGPLMGQMLSEPMGNSGQELRASDLPSSSITFHPSTEVKSMELDDEGSVMGRYQFLDEEPSLIETSKSSLDKAFSFEDEQSNLQRSSQSKELSSEDLEAAPPHDAGDSAAAGDIAAEPAPAPTEGEATEAEPGGDAENQPSMMAYSSITTEEAQEAGVYLVPPWALREHLRLETRASTPPLESMDKELQEVVKALQQAPALRGLPRPNSSPERPYSGGLVARMRHLVAATPDEPAPAARSGPTAALGTSLLSMSHPSRSTAKVQLQAQSQAMVKSKLPRQATHHAAHHAAMTASFASSTEPWRPGEVAADDVEPQPEALMDGDDPEIGEAGDQGGSIPPELSFIEEHFFLTEDDY